MTAAMVESTRDPATAVLNEVVPAGEPWMGIVRKGQFFRILDLEGNQAVDTLFYNAVDSEERYSASDTIRTKWAYYTALFETASAQARGHHLGLVTLDEPRQQETDHRSLAAFLERLNADRGLGQVVYATSEEAEVLARLLRDIPHNALPTSGRNLLVLDAD